MVTGETSPPRADLKTSYATRGGTSPAFRRRAARRRAFFFVSSWPQMRSTRQPARRRVRVTKRSRAWLRAILVSKKAEFDFG